MPISEAELRKFPWTLQTKAQSYEFGRRLYQIQTPGGLYWLKFQVVGQNLETQKAFEYEMACYQKLSHADWLLPHQIVSLGNSPETEFSTGQGLLTVHAPAFLTQPPQQFNLLQITELLTEMLHCMATWQNKNWLHGDIKHEHLVAYKGRCYLFDLEQSRPLNAPECEALSSTPRYMAPELFQGGAKSLQSDLYALGMVFWEWLSQQRLGKQNYHDWATWHCQQTRPALPVAYKSLQGLLDGLMAKRQSQRFANADVALKMLQYQLTSLNASN